MIEFGVLWMEVERKAKASGWGQGHGIMPVPRGSRAWGRASLGVGV